MATAGPKIQSTPEELVEILKLASDCQKPDERHYELSRFFSIYAPSPELRVKLVRQLLEYSYLEQTETLAQIVELFCDEIKPGDRLFQDIKGAFKDKSLLWLLALEASSTPQAFLTLFKKHQAKITLSDLLAQASDGGVSSLGNLARAANMGHPEALLSVWQKFQTEISLADLMSKASQDNMSPLDWICEWEPNFVDKILAQVPGVAIVTLLPERVEPLVCARNLYFEQLKKAKFESSPFSADYIKALFEEAAKAKVAGYLNAYYDLGKVLYSRQQLELAHEAYKKLPRTSCHYEEVNALLAEHHLSLATNLRTPEHLKAFHQREALKHALETDDLNRVRIIRKIVVICVGNEQAGYQFYQQFPSLEANASRGVIDFYFDAFQNLQRILTLEELNKRLHDKLKSSQQTAENDNGSLSKRLESLEATLRSFSQSNSLEARVAALENSFTTLSFSKSSESPASKSSSITVTPPIPGRCTPQ